MLGLEEGSRDFSDVRGCWEGNPVVMVVNF